MKYYILVGINKAEKGNTTFEMVFGDYDKETVKEEKDCVSHEYKKLSIITLENGNTASILATLNKLNGK
jgi:hypothetical protein